MWCHGKLSERRFGLNPSSHGDIDRVIGLPRTTTWSNNTVSLLQTCGGKRRMMNSLDR